MKTFEVCLSPALLHLHNVTDKVVVVVDILRATSSMVTAFAYGVAKVRPVAHIQECLALRPHGYLIAGERDGKKVVGFDFGNSPFDYQQDSIRGHLLAITTTNGTLAIEASKTARKLVIGSFLNIDAVATFLIQQENDVLVVCAGWKGHVNLEDSLFAGVLLNRLVPYFRANNDAALATKALFCQAQPDFMLFLSQSSHVQRLAKLNTQRDVEFCLCMDKYPVVPQLQEGHLIVPDANGASSGA